jgi:predicted pyridoxine 5'-phosphate oxidase superfamily flavin-nucleotide-binding protein
MARLPTEIRAALEGVIPASIGTCSLDGTPNATYVSQVFYVDPEHVALSFQFFNKTVRNIEENPRACVIVTDPISAQAWTLEIEFERAEETGPVFDQMEMQLEAIASMQGMQDVFKLRAAHVYRVTEVRPGMGAPG